MSEMIVKLKRDRVKIKGCEYVRDLVRCGECKWLTENRGCKKNFQPLIQEDYFCQYGEKEC